MKLFIRGTFGPKNEYIFKENQLEFVPRRDVIEVKKKVDELVGGGAPPPLEGIDTNETKAKEDTENKDKKWTRTFRVGKSVLYPSYPDDLLLLLEKYPLEFQVWTDDPTPEPELIGTGNLHWHTNFFSHIMENKDTCKPSKALSIKEEVPIMNECCCTQAGTLQLIVRLTPLGSSIETEFQQLLDKDPDIFIFKTDKCPSLFECKRIELDDKNYNTMGGLYEIACREDPEVVKRMNRKIEVCTELESCGVSQPGVVFACQHAPGSPEDFTKGITPKNYPIEKIRMGDIVGPCGNANCLLAHKMRIFIRNQYAYKRETLGQTFKNKPKTSKRVCGTCGCKHDLYHSEKAEALKKKPICKGCGKEAQIGETCDDRLKNLHGTGFLKKDVDNPITKAALAVGNEKGKDCTCFPTDPTRPCKTLDCECITRYKEAFTRLIHKPFCPSYKHKEACPVSHINDAEPDPTASPPPATDEEVTPLPYGLPPVKVGPCPVPGRPCRTDSAARLVKPAQAPQPAKEVPRKVQVSKEFDRIKKAMIEFQAEINNKPEFKCIHKTNVDTEKRCCDDDQRLLKMIGKSCCAEHKLAATTLYKLQAEREASEKRNALPPS
ncbi:hypothetical protein NE865_16272 [Phthorimaea operculella]|nr:hypothetical protein NE865_16272 [Phthorimaea operculella]